jgi:hypothetical protein
MAQKDFSSVRASLQLACFTFINMGRSGENNGISESLEFLYSVN